MNADSSKPTNVHPQDDRQSLERSSSFGESSFKKNIRPSLGSSRPKSFATRRGMFEVDGHSLEHWKKDNFEPKRDATCRVVYEPKEGKQFFQKTLTVEDYDIMRCLTTSLEQPYFSKYNRFFPQRGHFCCKACGNPLYSHETKFDIDDGWPAFRGCVLGSIGITPAEERKAQIEKEDKACIKIQAFVRGNQCRSRVENMLDELIRDLLKRKDGDPSKEEEKKSSSSEEGGETKGRFKGSGMGYILSRELGDNYAEIHCHRCKSHLGDVFAEENTGNNGEEYKEHHRVNGRAMKYMHADLPKRTMVEASLLFADQSQRRRLGLPDAKEKDEPDLPFSRFPLRSRRKPSDSLSVSNHESTYRSTFGRNPSDPLSVTSHESSYQSSHRKNSDPPNRKKKAHDPLGSVSCHERMISPTTKTKAKSRRRPMRRGHTDSLIDVEERKAYLEDAFLKLSLH